MRSLASWLPVAGARGVKLSPGVGMGLLATCRGRTSPDGTRAPTVGVLEPGSPRASWDRPAAAGWVVCGLPPLSHDAQVIRETGLPALAFAHPLRRIFTARNSEAPGLRPGDPVIVDGEEGILWAPVRPGVRDRWRERLQEWPGEKADPGGWEDFLRSGLGPEDLALGAFLLLVSDRPEIPCRRALLVLWRRLGIPTTAWEAAASMTLDRIRRRAVWVQERSGGKETDGVRLERARALLAAARDLAGRLECMECWHSRAVEAVQEAERVLDRTETERVRSVREGLAAWRSSPEPEGPQALSRARSLLRFEPIVARRAPELHGELLRLGRWVREAGRRLWEASSHPLVRSFPDDGVLDADLVGGKAALLAASIPHLPPGVRLADGFVVTTAAWRAFFAGGPLAELDEAWKGRGPDLRSLSRRCRAAIVAAGIPEPLREAVAEAWRRLGAPKVAARSSAVFEDRSGAGGAAGLLDSFPDIGDPVELNRRIRDVWLSAWTPEALELAQARGWNPAATPVAVLVQRQVDVRWSGVAILDESAPEAGRVLVNLAPGSWDVVTRGRTAGWILLVELEPPFQVRPAWPSGAAPQGAGPAPPERGMRPLVELFRALQARLGCAPEVEFGLDDECCWLFQVRRRQPPQATPDDPGS